MADSARAAAEQSRIAAEASVAAVEASIEVHFDFAPAIGWSFDRFKELVNQHDPASSDLFDVFEDLDENLWKFGAWREVDLTCRGATVTLHGLEVTSVGTAKGPPLGTDENGYLEGQLVDVTCFRDGEMVLTPVERLPRLCHAGETIRFKVGNRPVDEGIVELRAAVFYAFGGGPVRTREVRWRKKIDAHGVRRIIHD